jgi:hypothetical protein
MKQRPAIKLPPDDKWQPMGPEEVEVRAAARTRCPNGFPEEDWSKCSEIVQQYILALLQPKQAARSTLHQSLRSLY